MADKQLKVVVVTPERAVLEDFADMVILPMFDGELGVLPGRAALVGQLGPGELRIKQGATTRRLFIDGGFAQVRADSVNVLTQFARKPEELTAASVADAQAKAEAQPTTSAPERATKAKLEARARSMAKLKDKIARL